MPISIDRRLLVIFVLGLVALVATSSFAASQEAPQIAYIFGLGPYPGGALKTVFELQRGGADGAVHFHTIEITPNGDLFDVTETIVSPDQSADDISTGGGRTGAAGAVGTKYDETKVATIDLSPLQALEERNVEIAPNQNYYLPDGARLVTHDWEKIAGIDVVMATFLHPSFPNQTVEIALTAPDTSALLSFPALLVKKVDGEVEYRVELVEIDYTP